DHVGEGIAADQVSRGTPVNLRATQGEWIVLSIDALAALVQAEGTLNQRLRTFVQIIFPRDSPATLAIGHPGVEFEEDIQVMPPAIVLGLHRFVPIPEHK